MPATRESTQRTIPLIKAVFFSVFVLLVYAALTSISRFSANEGDRGKHKINLRVVESGKSAVKDEGHDHQQEAIALTPSGTTTQQEKPITTSQSQEHEREAPQQEEQEKQKPPQERYKTRTGNLEVEVFNPPSTFHSTVHCGGAPPPPPATSQSGKDGDWDKTWTYRSCHVRNLCYDIESREFVVFRRTDAGKGGGEFHAQKDLDETIARENGVSISFTGDRFPHINQNSNTFDTSVSLGAINPKWTWGGVKGAPPYSEKDRVGGKIWAMEWFPRVVDIGEEEVPKSIYHLVDGDTYPTLVPYHSMAAHNIGHLVWDDILPIFTLSSMFEGVIDAESSGEREGPLAR